MKVLCLVCSKRCKGEVLRVQDRYVHKGCFACCQCRRSLERGGFFLRDGKLYCPDDFARLHGVRCRGCGGAATGEVATAMGATFHPACFRCEGCQAPFSPGDRVVLWPERDAFLCRDCAQTETALRQPLSIATDNNGLSNEEPSIAPKLAAPVSAEASGSSRRYSNDDFDSSTRRDLVGSVDGLSNGGARSVISNAGGGVSVTPATSASRSVAASRSGPQRRTRSYLSIQSEIESRLPPSDRYRRGLSPCGSVRSLSPRRQLRQQQQQQQQHFHVPQPQQTHPPTSRSTMSITTAPSTPASLASMSRRSRSVAGGASRPGSIGGGRRRRSPSVGGGGAVSADEDENDPVLLSQFPGASKPDLSRPAPIERDDWPCPPLAALLPDRRGRQRNRQRSPEPETPSGDRSSTRATRQLVAGQLELGCLGSALLLSGDSGMGGGVGRSSGGLSMRFSPSIDSSLHNQLLQQRPDNETTSELGDRRSLSSAASPRPGYTMGLLASSAGISD